MAGRDLNNKDSAIDMDNISQWALLLNEGTVSAVYKNDNQMMVTPLFYALHKLFVFKMLSTFGESAPH